MAELSDLEVDGRPIRTLAVEPIDPAAVVAQVAAAARKTGSTRACPACCELGGAALGRHGAGEHVARAPASAEILTPLKPDEAEVAVSHHHAGVREHSERNHDEAREQAVERQQQQVPVAMLEVEVEEQKAIGDAHEEKRHARLEHRLPPERTRQDHEQRAVEPEEGMAKRDTAGWRGTDAPRRLPTPIAAETRVGE